MTATAEERDLIDFIETTITQWYSSKHVTADQMVALQWLHRTLERRTERRAAER